MLAEIVALLAPALQPDNGDGCVLVDCTLGAGGHAEALLTACPQARLIGIDRDPHALAVARERLAPYADRVTLVEAVYDELPELLATLGSPQVQGCCCSISACPPSRSTTRSVGSATSVTRPWT
jgi:16S rRNA (cytosine1402-N4)-methyltransferase